MADDWQVKNVKNEYWLLLSWHEPIVIILPLIGTTRIQTNEIQPMNMTLKSLWISNNENDVTPIIYVRRTIVIALFCKWDVFANVMFPRVKLNYFSMKRWAWVRLNCIELNKLTSLTNYPSYLYLPNQQSIKDRGRGSK